MMGFMMAMFKQMQQGQGQSQGQGQQREALIQFSGPSRQTQLSLPSSLPSYQLAGFRPEEQKALAGDEKEPEPPTDLHMSEATGALLAAAGAAGAGKKKGAAGAGKKTMKRPSAAGNKIKKRPAAAPARTDAQRRAARPNGCSKCRGKPGCTKSCWAANTNPW